jgi:hypothetical protein
MASRRPKLLPEIFVPPAGAPAQRRTHVHIVPTNGKWGIRVGRRVESIFTEQADAVLAAMPLARERGVRLFLHYESGVIQESSTSLADETLLRILKMRHEKEDKRRAQPPVHVVRDGDGWGMRVGRRIKMRFSDRSEAVEAAMPFARTRGVRLFVHYESGEIRESATGEGEELLFKAWRQIRAPGGWQGEA